MSPFIAYIKLILVHLNVDCTRYMYMYMQSHRQLAQALMRWEPTIGRPEVRSNYMSCSKHLHMPGFCIANWTWESLWFDAWQSQLYQPVRVYPAYSCRECGTGQCCWLLSCWFCIKPALHKMKVGSPISRQGSQEKEIWLQRLQKLLSSILPTGVLQIVLVGKLPFLFYFGVECEVLLWDKMESLFLYFESWHWSSASWSEGRRPTFPTGILVRKEGRSK